MKASEFDKLTKEERAAIISTWSGERLLHGYEWYCANHDPINWDRCDTFNLIKSEMLRRIKNS